MSDPRPRRTSTLAPLLAPVVLLAVMWAVQFADAVLPGTFTVWGLRSWDPSGLPGIVVGPLLHAGWAHLIGNSLPFLVLGALVAVEGAGRFWLVTVVVAVVGGAGTWLLNPPGTVTVGASGLVFGFFAYVLCRVLVARSVGHRIAYALVALVVMALYGGSMLAGIVAAPAGVSWQAHLFGAIGGIVAALLTRPRRTSPTP
ncbi:rhomboid family intramembrane serine protease [Microbacterium resistens]